MTPAKSRKKLIEVALPLDAVNKASAREKSIRRGHPSTLHLWWARRPPAAARAVIFAQMVDDPSEYVDALLSDPAKKRAAERERKRRMAENVAQHDPNQAQTIPQPTLEGVSAEIERERLFRILEDLVRWENSTNEEVLERARAENRQSWRRACADNVGHPEAKALFNPDKPPAFHDPFAGGGARAAGLHLYALHQIGQGGLRRTGDRERQVSVQRESGQAERLGGGQGGNQARARRKFPVFDVGDAD